MVEGDGFEIRCRFAPTEGSNPSLSAIHGGASGEMTEWLKVHDWKSCVGKLTGGSNPPLSAIFQRAQ